MASAVQHWGHMASWPGKRVFGSVQTFLVVIKMTERRWEMLLLAHMGRGQGPPNAQDMSLFSPGTKSTQVAKADGEKVRAPPSPLQCPMGESRFSRFQVKPCDIRTSLGRSGLWGWTLPSWQRGSLPKNIWVLKGVRSGKVRSQERDGRHDPMHSCLSCFYKLSLQEKPPSEPFPPSPPAVRFP